MNQKIFYLKFLGINQNSDESFRIVLLDVNDNAPEMPLPNSNRYFVSENPTLVSDIIIFYNIPKNNVCLSISSKIGNFHMTIFIETTTNLLNCHMYRKHIIIYTS